MKNEKCPRRDDCWSYKHSGCGGCNLDDYDEKFNMSIEDYCTCKERARNDGYKVYNYVIDELAGIKDWRKTLWPNKNPYVAPRGQQRTDVLDALMYAMTFPVKPEITNVKFNPPATIVFWSDKTKTVVKAQDDEPFDPEKGLAMAMLKKYAGNKGSYFNEISKWTEKYVDPKDPLGVGKDIVHGFEKAMSDAGKSASAVSECADNIKRIFNVPQEFTFEGTISDTDAIRGLLGYDKPCEFTLTFDTTKVEEKTECPWCSSHSEYTIIDDDFGQPLHPKMINFCFSCGRDLRKDGKK